MNIDPTGCYQQTASVDLAAGSTGFTTDVRDLIAVNRHVTVEALNTGPIDDCSVANHQVMHLLVLPRQAVEQLDPDAS
jgi:hypothetical protein